MLDSWYSDGHGSVIYIRGEYGGREQLELAIAEVYEKGFLGINASKTGLSFDIYSHHGAGAYICGKRQHY